MINKFKKLSIILTSLVLMMMLASCSKTEETQVNTVITKENGEKIITGTLDIASINLGYGVDWLNNVIDGFTAKYPGVKVNTKYSTSTTKIYLYLTTNKSNPYDLVFVETSQVFGYSQNPNLVPGYGQLPYACVDDVFDYVCEGETKTIAERQYEGISKYFTSSDGHHYATPTAMTLFGILYNYDKVKEEELPVTTNEFVALTDKLRTDTFKPVVWTKDANYWDEILETWWAQYQGIDEFKSFYSGKIDGQYNIDVLKQEGRLEALKVLDSLIKVSNGRVDADSSALPFNEAQTRFMDGISCFYPCGSWIENEMKLFYEPGTAPISYMKTPVISSIVKTLEYRNGDSYMTDKDLAKIIKAIDNGAKTKEDVSDILSISDNDFGRIYEARTMDYLEGIIDSVVIPSWSDSIEIAKEFLKYMYSDEGIRLYMKANSGSSLPVYYDYSPYTEGLSVLQKKRLEVMGKAENYLFRPRNRQLFNGGSFKTTGIQKQLGSTKQMMSPEQIYQFDIDFYSANDQAEWKELIKSNK